ncbi:MAG: hypothetical protein IPJ77_11995 [Planctomycetes bacterium]|nr:hypothetical protein [Planctomycetota bacterium]
MKTSVLSILVVGATVAALSFANRSETAGSTALAAPQAGDTKDAKKDAAAMELEALKLKCDALGAELADTKGALEQVVKYLDAQSQHAKAMEAVLDDAEKKGFTFGINPESREVLLKGWREQCAALQRDVPALKPAKKDAPAKPTARN